MNVITRSIDKFIKKLEKAGYTPSEIVYRAPARALGRSKNDSGATYLSAGSDPSSSSSSLNTPEPGCSSSSFDSHGLQGLQKEFDEQLGHSTRNLDISESSDPS